MIFGSVKCLRKNGESGFLRCMGCAKLCFCFEWKVVSFVMEKYALNVSRIDWGFLVLFLKSKPVSLSALKVLNPNLLFHVCFMIFGRVKCYEY